MSCVACVAFVSKRNDPLYLNSFGEDESAFHFMVHSVLDVFDERRRGDDASAGDRSFLGLLCPIGEYKVYGYTTITQVKIIIIMRDDFDRVNDTDVRGLFREVRGHFVEAVSNPFATVGEKITSPKFDRKVRSTVKARNRTWFTQ